MFVTDTHPLVFYFADQKRLPRQIKQIFDDARLGKAAVYVPSAVFWEISLNISTGGSIQLSVPFEDFVTALLRVPTFIERPINSEIIKISHGLNFHNDPFDKMIVATAIDLGLPLITGDNVITKSEPCPLVW
jgi:PIN domain nuclease of toxin-antitoxin system